MIPALPNDFRMHAILRYVMVWPQDLIAESATMPIRRINSSLQGVRKQYPIANCTTFEEVAVLYFN